MKKPPRSKAESKPPTGLGNWQHEYAEEAMNLLAAIVKALESIDSKLQTPQQQPASRAAAMQSPYLCGQWPRLDGDKDSWK